MKRSMNFRDLHQSCKTGSLLNLILVLSVVLLGASCSYKISYKVRQSKIYQGDSVAITWKITHPGKIKTVSFGKTGNPLPLEGKAYFTPLKDTLIEFYVYQKGQQKPLKKIQRKINVLKPEITGFSAIRDRFNNNKVMLNWSVKDYDAKDKTRTSVYIEGYYYNLAASGSITIPDFPQATTFTMVVKSPSRVVTKSCYVDGIITNQRPMIKKDTAIYKLPGNRKLFMKIIETNISDYPDNIKLKVIVYDSITLSFMLSG